MVFGGADVKKDPGVVARWLPNEGEVMGATLTMP